MNGFEISLLGGVAFSEVAHRLIKLNPDIPRSVFRAFMKLRGTKGVVSKDKSIFLENLPLADGRIGNGFFALKIGKRNFFLKVTENEKLKEKFSPHDDLALSQYNSLIKAKQLIMKSNLKEHIDVVTPQFAFVSKKYSFLVTDFFNYKRVEDILKGKDHNLKKEVRDALYLFNAAEGYLDRRGFRDMGGHNAFYSPKLKKFILFDLRYYFE